MKSLLSIFAAFALLACLTGCPGVEAVPEPIPIPVPIPEPDPIPIPAPDLVPALAAGCCQTADGCAFGDTVNEENCAEDLAGTWIAGTECNTDTGVCE
jgi:hypothetical protein